MKTYKLLFHTNKTIKNQDILISAKDFPDVNVGDVLEVYHPEDEWNRLLLQVKSLPDDLQQKDSVIIEPGIANAFSLRQYHNVVVNKVDPETVKLDLVELLFKELYFGRSDMWRICKTLTNTCVYLKKQIEFAEKRVHVNELWTKGENVTCGIITEDTRIVFRSPTAVVQIFIQMSTEMWDFDLHGDLYFEKAVNGFLTDLFEKWKEQNCVHDVTIVLFSRTFYDAKSLEEFPPAIRECLLMDSNGRIYEDYYRVIVQNERYEEWQSILRQIRTLCNCYQDLVLHYHDDKFPDWKMPKASLSVASQGNFLETLNMSLNLFENYYMDRNFDRTGKVSVVITPGPGVFEVDRQLANITKQRTIDCGVGSDLVCMGEQPLHAAPLFKFHSKTSYKSIEVGDDYSIPHWMNHSFYMSKNQIHDHTTYAFLPRIKPPPAMMKELDEIQNYPLKSCFPPQESSDDNIPFVDYDEYDNQVFKLPSGPTSRITSTKRGGTAHSSRGTVPKTFAEARQMLKPRDRHISDDVSVYLNDHEESMAAVSIPSTGSSHDDMSYSFGCPRIPGKAMSRSSYESSESDELILQRPVVGSAGSPVGHSRHLNNYRPHRALINPFAPSRLQFKMTSNRRRWAHAFPVDHKGMAIHARHVHHVEHNEHDSDFLWSEKTTLKSPVMTITTSSKKKKSAVGLNDRQDPETPCHADECVSESPVLKSDHGASSVKRNILDHHSGRQHSSKLTLSNKVKTMFGSTKESEHEWSSDMTTAVDWKSLTIPASLPVTTDYFPDTRSIQYDYVVSDYELLPECVNAEIWSSWPRSPTCEDKTLLVYRRQPLTTQQVFLELISQRLGQGFQLITKKKSRQQLEVKQSTVQSPSAQFMRAIKRHPNEEYHMSIGRIYHKLILNGQAIRVTRYWPRHPQPQLHYNYRYRFQAPDSDSYDVSWTNFSNEKLENYNWNHLDQYICTQGDWEYGLIDSLKYWRSRFFLLPLNNTATKKIIEDEKTRCDIYEEKTPKELMQLVTGFVKFLENMNKLKRTVTQRKSKGESAAPATSGVQLSSGTGSSADPSQKKPEQESTKDVEKLSTLSPSVKILEALLDTVHGLSLIQGQAGLPLNTFISAEAVDWCQRNVTGAETVSLAVELMQRLLDEQYILHCSGNLTHKFIYGFYLYYIPPKIKAAQPSEGNTHPALHFSTPGSNFNYLFQNEWCEVSILPVQAMDEDNGMASEENKETGNSFFVQPTTSRRRSDSMLQPELEDWRILTAHVKEGPGQQQATLLHKYTNVEVDPGKKSDRNEYAIARYHAYYSPKCAFELQLQWMVATGCIMGDLVQTYARRATSCGFHLIPVPCDPFALPYTENSDPLRGPIFVPLNMNAFDSELFQVVSNERRQEMLFIIQDAIIKRFGFLPASVKVPEDPAVLSREKANINHQYVHCTAGMFILIPESVPGKPDLSPSPGIHSVDSSAMLKKSSSELHQLYIARLGRPEAAPNGVGFLWSWNYMSSRRWRSPSTGDETFQDRMLADFRKFCANEENRLSEFWENSKSSLQPFLSSE